MRGGGAGVGACARGVVDVHVEGDVVSRRTYDQGRVDGWLMATREIQRQLGTVRQNALARKETMRVYQTGLLAAEILSDAYDHQEAFSPAYPRMLAP